jgi:hypothetical protein
VSGRSEWKERCGGPAEEEGDWVREECAHPAEIAFYSSGTTYKSGIPFGDQCASEENREE